MDSAIDDQRMTSIGAHRCPNCRMLFTSTDQLQKHLDKFCTFDRSRADNRASSVGRNGRHAASNVAPFGLLPSHNEIDRESSRLLRELADYRKRNRDQRSVDEAIERKMADELLDKQQRAAGAGRNGAVNSETFRRQVLALASSGRDRGLDGRLNADVKYVLKASARAVPAANPTNRGSFNMVQKIEELRAQMANLQLKGDLDPLTDLLLQINELRQSYLRYGGNDPALLSQLTQMQTDTQALRRQQVQASLRETERANEAEAEAAVLRLQQQNATLEAQLAAARSQSYRTPQTPTQPWLPVPVPMSAVQAPYVAPQQYYPPVDSAYSQRLQLQQTRNPYDDDIKAEISALKAEVQALRQEQLLQPPVQVPVPAPPVPLPVAPSKPPMPVSQVVEEFANKNDAAPTVVLFYDFLAGLEAPARVARLIITTFTAKEEMGEPYMMPSVECSNQVAQGASTSNVALVNSRQMMRPLARRPDLFVVVELQVGVEGVNRLETRGWLRIRVFDLKNHLIDGRFRATFRVPPIAPILRDDELQKVQLYGSAELFYRVVLAEQSDAEMLVENALPVYANTYAVPPVWERLLEDYVMDSNSFPPNESLGRAGRFLDGAFGGRQETKRVPLQLYYDERNLRFKEAELRPDADHVGAKLEQPLASYTADKVRRLGIRICFVKNAEAGLGKVRISIYEARTGRLGNVGDLPLSANTAAAHQSFKHKYHVFGQEEALFDDVELRFDHVVIIRFYLKRVSPRTAQRVTQQPDDLYIKDPQADPEATSAFEEDELVAWTCMPLLVPRTSGTLVYADRKDYSRPGEEYNMSQLVVASGLRTLPLYLPPVGEPWQMTYAQFNAAPPRFKRYGKSKIRIRILAEEYHFPDFMSSSTRVSRQLDDYDLVREALWLPLKRHEPPKKPFYASDGFDLYIDGCRFLPDGVSLTLIYGAFYSRKWKRLGPPVSVTQLLDSDVFHPQYDYRLEIREPALPPSLTLLLTLITYDTFTKAPRILGYASINVFCQLGTEKQPDTDQNVIQVALNEGGHQVRIYPSGPNRTTVLSNSWSAKERLRPLPGASLLLRLVRAPVGPSGRTLDTATVPKGEWVRLGLIQAKPLYRDNVYESFTCEPWPGERAILHSLERRPPIAAADSCRSLSERTLVTIDAVRDFISYNMLPKMEVDIGRLLEWDTSYVAPYDSEYGFALTIDRVCNLPWRNVTLGYVSINPPGAFYMGPPYQNYDPIKFFTTLNWQLSTTGLLIFGDPFKTFQFRSHTKYLTAILQFHEVTLVKTSTALQGKLLKFAWCAVPLFIDKFARTETITVPLFVGMPSTSELILLSQMPLEDFIAQSRKNNTVEFLKGAYAIVYVADARRKEEMQTTKDYNIRRWSSNYIPPDLLPSYQQNLAGTPLLQLVPQFLNEAEFETNIVERFREMVYLTYEVAPRVVIQKSALPDQPATSSK